MSSRGRPVATSPAQIEAAAFRLFAERGFEAVTMSEIAAEVGVGRRTLFRYFESKNDIPWGQFDQTLEHFRAILRELPQDRPVHEVVQQGVLAFNEFDPAAEPPHRERMRLILETPTLQAHSVLRYAEWRSVIAEYVAERLDLRPDDLLPRTAGGVALTLAISAYEAWLEDPAADLADLLTATMSALRSYLAD
ncbi:mycofactocin system transcriptional regulator [Nocardioides mangrovi]|uniref:Mycofactocin system transcriptional regulator n=1 Tax=Nocardioides mangrovi TaxID=2874580 RepID=A0ABS7UF55_9ACTN|nr:mycofactocin system transcriptional regulator [Nocardioides mangrovi]MBZ5739445.1 mycofactocin system transcriptional regulator [Nocardioides mangrovi]